MEEERDASWDAGGYRLCVFCLIMMAGGGGGGGGGGEGGRR